MELLAAHNACMSSAESAVLKESEEHVAKATDCPAKLNGVPIHPNGGCACYRNPRITTDSHYVVTVRYGRERDARMITETPPSSEKFQNGEYEIPRSNERRRSNRRNSGQPFSTLDRRGTLRVNNRSVKQGKQWRTSGPERSVLRYTTG